jgi:hypothetical protein
MGYTEERLARIHQSTAVLLLERYARELMETNNSLSEMTTEPGAPGLDERSRARVTIACRQVSAAAMTLAGLVNEMSEDVLS